MATPRTLVGPACIAAAALLSGSLVGSAAGAGKTPARHVICSKVTTWIPADYDGGCYLTFSPAIRKAVYAGFTAAAKTDSQWVPDPDPAPPAPQWKAMKCRRGGVANRVPLNKWQAGTCTWGSETFGHRGYGDHPDHEWHCTVTMVVRTSMNGKTKMKRGRPWMQWDATASPLQATAATAGTYPWCSKRVPDDTWTSDFEVAPLT